MQDPINDTAQLGQLLKPSNDAPKVKAIDYTSNFKHITDKVDKLELLMERGTMDVNLIKYLPGRTSYVKRYDGCQSYKISTWYDSYCVSRYGICYTNKKRIS